MKKILTTYCATLVQDMNFHNSEVFFSRNVPTSFFKVAAKLSQQYRTIVAGMYILL